MANKLKSHMKEHNPFSFYDFLGYLIPGFTVLIIIYLSNVIQQGQTLESVLEKSQYEISIGQWILIIIVSYFFGHVLSFLSSITVEKYSYWKYDYPSKYLMKIAHGKKYYIGEWHVRVWRTIVAIIILPVVVGDYFFGHLLKFKDVYVKGIDDFLIDSIKIRAQNLFQTLNLSPPPGLMRDYDYHRIFAHYILQKSDAVNQKTSNYIALYGYLRCLTLILSLSFWFVVAKLTNAFCEYDCICRFYSGEKNLIVFLVVLNLLAYLLFMAFMKFYRRYSLENLMAIVTNVP